MKMIMEGTEFLRDYLEIMLLRICSVRWRSVADSIRQELGMFSCEASIARVEFWFVVALHQMLNEMNKMKRPFFPQLS